MLKKLLAVILVGVFVAMSFAGCSSKQQGSTEKTIKLAWVCPGTNSQYWNQYVGTGIRNACLDIEKKYNVKVELSMAGPTEEGNTDEYISILESVIAKKPDAIVTGTMQPDGTAPVVKEAAKAGIFVNLFSLGITDNEDSYGTLYYCDQPQQGTIAADAFVKLLEQKGLPKKGIVGMHLATLVPILMQKMNNFKTELTKLCPDIQVLDVVFNQNDVNKAESNVENQISTYGSKLIGFFGGNNLSGDGISLSVKNAGLGNKLVSVVIDSDDLEIQALREGNIDAIVAQTPYAQGYGAAYNALEHIINGATDPKMVNLPAKVVTKANMDETEYKALLDPTILLEPGAPAPQ
jgi:ribose transport system substrate-binding protein